jgi:hypothetical protein
MFSFRQFGALALTAVFATVSLLGTGLHLLPGCDHFHAPDGCCCTHHRSCHSDCGQSACTDYDYHPSPNSQGDLGQSDSDCPICRFLAIPRALTPPIVIPERTLYVEPLVESAPPLPAHEALRPYGARAPPRTSLHLA